MGALKIVAAWYALVLLVGCGQDRSGPGIAQAPLSETDRGIAIDGVTTIRDLFNEGGCQSIYDGAAKPFRTQRIQDWLENCAQLRDDLGEWLEFRAGSLVACGSPDRVVCVDGTAVFANGTRAVEVTWLVGLGQRGLVAVAVRDRQNWVRFPPSPSRLWFDPPLAPRGLGGRPV